MKLDEADGKCFGKWRGFGLGKSMRLGELGFGFILVAESGIRSMLIQIIFEADVAGRTRVRRRLKLVARCEESSSSCA